MPTWVIALISAEYLIAGVWFALKGQWGMVLFAFGCGCANVGLLIEGR